MATYNTASEEQSKNINTFKSNCLALDSLIGKGLLSIAKDFKTVAEALEYFSNNIYNANMEKAREIYENTWFKMSKTTLAKHLWSDGEITKWLNQKGSEAIIKATIDQFHQIFRYLEKMEKYIDMFSKIAEVGKSIISDYSDGRYTITIKTEDLESCEVIRQNMRKAARNFELLMAGLEVLNTFSPKGCKEYLEFVFATFNKAKQLFSIVDDYTNTIHELAEETNVWYKVIDNDSSWFNATKMVERTGDANAFLDHIEYLQKKREQFQAQKRKDRNEINRQLDFCVLKK